ncbi:MAG: histone deacetylase [Armatimonadota bacterium]|nr:histone deacetylase [Armatimonadota bacterium]
MKTAFLSHPHFRDHDAGPGHPERPARLEAIEKALRQEGLWDELDHRKIFPADDEDILRCHTPEHLERIRHLAQAGGGWIDSDTHVSSVSFDVAKLAVGAALGAVDAVLGGECDNAFVAARPPGHHAESHHAMGFCLFNNVACAARSAQRQHGLQRVAILDWDVHHGNGTQEIFYDDPSVFFVSTHQWPLYPGTGRAEERGRGAGLGTTLNFPLPAGSGDYEYACVWESIGETVETFRPQLILVSAGFDAHIRDPLANMLMSAAGFERLMRETKRWAAQWCDNRVVCVLEGGYDLSGLSSSVVAVVRELMNDES